MNQFKQGGFRFYFRMTEEEVMTLSRQLTYDYQERKKLFQRLVTLPKGQCLMMGLHMVGKSRNISEAFRFVEVTEIKKEEEVKEKDKNIRKRKIIAVYNKGKSADGNSRKGREEF